jgi:hypothetical protein
MLTFGVELRMTSISLPDSSATPISPSTITEAPVRSTCKRVHIVHMHIKHLKSVSIDALLQRDAPLNGSH